MPLRLTKRRSQRRGKPWRRSVAAATITCRCFTRFASENDAMKWDFFVRHYASDALQKQDPKYYATRSTARPSTASSIPAPVRWADVPPTTR